MVKKTSTQSSKLPRLSVAELKAQADPSNFKFFNAWVMEFFKREVMREKGTIDQYVHDPMFGDAMRQEVSFWNPNRSKHAEVFWLEKYVFGNDNFSLRSQILNAMAVKFVGMPTLTLVATDSADFSNVIDFDEYRLKGEYFKTINANLDVNKWKTKVWGATQLQTSLQTAARNFVRDEEGDQTIPFRLSHMLRWIDHLDKLGLSAQVMDPKNKLSDVCRWLSTHRGIGPYFSYHPPCNFSRCEALPNIDEDDDFCLIGPGAKNGLQNVFPGVKFNKNDVMEQYILSIRDHQYDFFEFADDAQRNFYKENLERDGFLTTFGVEITFCQYSCYLAIRNSPKLQEKRMLPLTFESFVKIADNLKARQEEFAGAVNVADFFTGT